MLRPPRVLPATSAREARSGYRGGAGTAWAVLLLASSALHGADCTAPRTPDLPDGATASREAMLSGQEAVRDFQARNMDYMQCLEAIFSASKRTARNASDATERERAQATYAEALEAYNAAVSAEEALAGAFNIELREYKAAHR